MAPDLVESIGDATELLVDQQDVTPLGLAYQAIEIHTSEDPLDAALRRVLRAMKVYRRPAGPRHGHHRLPRRRRRDHVRRVPDPRRGRRAGGARAPVRVAGRDVADQLPAARPRGARHRPAAGHRGAGRRRRGRSRPRPGSPVFGSVGEYEAALDADRRRGRPDDRRTWRAPARPARRGRQRAAGRRPGARRRSRQGDGRPIDPSRDTAPTQRVRASPITEPASDDYGAPGIATAAAYGPAPSPPGDRATDSPAGASAAGRVAGRRGPAAAPRRRRRGGGHCPADRGHHGHPADRDHRPDLVLRHRRPRGDRRRPRGRRHPGRRPSRSR